jgi:hypothetical protein
MSAVEGYDDFQATAIRRVHQAGSRGLTRAAQGRDD